MANRPRSITKGRSFAALIARGSQAPARDRRVYMTFLRRKLEPDPLHPRLFRTEAGVGYRLLADDRPPEPPPARG